LAFREVGSMLIFDHGFVRLSIGDQDIKHMGHVIANKKTSIGNSFICPLLHLEIRRRSLIVFRYQFSTIKAPIDYG
jgi:hypothetical protein